MSREKMILPKDLKELKALLNEWIQKRQQLELESVRGKLKKISDLANARKRMAQIKTKIQEIESKEHLPVDTTRQALQAGITKNK